jgi:hypothetical protein
MPARIIILLSVINIFIIGPAASFQFGLGQSLIIIFPIHYALGAILFYFLRSRFTWLSTLEWVRLIAECILCPVYLPMLLRRLTLMSVFYSDGILLIKKYGSDDNFKSLVESADIRINDFDDDLMDDARKLEIATYLMDLKSS